MPPPPDPLGGTTVIPPNASVSPPSPMSVGTGIEYRTSLVRIDAKTADGSRQRLLRPLPVQRIGFAAHASPRLNEPIGLTAWTSEAEVVPMSHAGTATPWINVAGTVGRPHRRPDNGRPDGCRGGRRRHLGPGEEPAAAIPPVAVAGRAGVW